MFPWYGTTGERFSLVPDHIFKDWTTGILKLIFSTFNFSVQVSVLQLSCHMAQATHTYNPSQAHHALHEQVDSLEKVVCPAFERAGRTIAADDSICRFYCTLNVDCVQEFKT